MKDPGKNAARNGSKPSGNGRRQNGRDLPPSEEKKEMPKVAVKKTAAPKAAKTKLTATDEYVVIDYPRNLETVLTGHHYSVRVGASDCNGVDISINDQPWQPCRNACGFWWFDWANYPAGTHQIVARMHKPNGEYLISKRRRCKAI